MILKNKVWGRQMAWWEKVFVSKLDDLSSSLRSYMVEIT